MDRCHLHLPLVDSSGGLYPYAEVTLLDEETGRPVEADVFLGPIGGAPETWPILIDPAVISLWTEQPLRVVVQAALPGGVTFTRTGVDIVPAPAATVRSLYPLHIGSSDNLDGSAVLAISPDGTATWQVLDALRTHRHEGDAPGSTVLGPANLTDIYPNQTWVGTSTGAAGADQGADATALGTTARSSARGVALGDAVAARGAVAAGSGASAGPDSIAIGETASAPGTAQTVLGQHASAQAAVDGAVVIGPRAAGAAGEDVALSDAVSLFENGDVVIGRGTLPSYQGLTGDTFTTLLGNVLIPRYLAARDAAVVGGPARSVGFFGPTGALRTLISSTGITSTTPGRTAFLSLLQALDRLGLIYLLDGAVDDELADWTKTSAHDANLVIETGDAAGSYLGDTARIKRDAPPASSATYHLAAGIRDFAIHAYTFGSTDITPEVTAQVSTDGVTWTAAPLDWRPLTATANSWLQTWGFSARALSSATSYLRITLGGNAAVFAPQVGRIIVRPRIDNLTGFGSGLFGQNGFGG